MDYLFVYGTLKRGYSNHRFLEGGIFLCEAETVDKYMMLDVGVPLVLKGAKFSVIKGELYLVDEEILRRCDRLEGHPYHYRRERVLVRCLGGHAEVMAWMYFWVKGCRTGVLIEDGEWKGRF